MDLKSGTLYWPQLPHPQPRSRPLQANIHCDVIVIGAGLSGAMIAHALSREALDVVVLDKREPGCGSTSASTALVLYEIDTPLVQLIRQRGRSDAIRSYQRCLETIGELGTLASQLPGPCGFGHRRSLYLASHRHDLELLKREFEARKRAGFAVEFLTREDIEEQFSFSYPGAIYSATAAEVNPFQLARLLMDESARRGARIFTGTEAANVTETRGGVVVDTRSGYRIQARWAVMATGFETDAKVARRVVKLKSSYALITHPVPVFPGWPGRCLIWETNRPYVYLRTTPDHRIIIGGEDEPFVDPRQRDRLIKKKGQVLSQRLQQMFPSMAVEPACTWAGTFGETKDGLPYIGSLKPRSRVIYALCYGANGTNFAVIAAELIRDSILEKRNRNKRLFDFDR